MLAEALRRFGREDEAREAEMESQAPLIIYITFTHENISLTAKQVCLEIFRARLLQAKVALGTFMQFHCMNALKFCRNIHFPEILPLACQPLQ